MAEILIYFINISKRQDLEEFGASRILEDCLKAVKTDSAYAEPKDVENTFQLEKLHNNRQTQTRLEPVKVGLLIGREDKFRRLSFQDLPLHNIFDTVALLYSLCIDEVTTERDGELYLV